MSKTVEIPETCFSYAPQCMTQLNARTRLTTAQQKPTKQEPAKKNNGGRVDGDP